MQVRNVYYVNDVHHGVYIKFLYDLLKERLDHPEWNISHTKMPTWEEHVKFVHNAKYRMYRVIVNADYPTQCIAAFYVTKQNEIGIHVAEQFRGKGYAKKIIQDFLDIHPDEVFYANINPQNEKSVKFFVAFGFGLIQHTYALKREITLD